MRRGGGGGSEKGGGGSEKGGRGKGVTGRGNSGRVRKEKREGVLGKELGYDGGTSN